MLAQRSFVSTSADDDCGEAILALEEGGTPASATKLPLSYFGVGIGADRKRGGPDRITEAAIVGGKITTLDDENTIAGPILEAHALAITIKRDWAVKTDDGQLFVTKEKPCKAPSEFPTVATGPFAMLRLGDKEIIKSFGVGWMIGFRLRQSESSLNVGVAYTFQQDVKTYAKGFEEGIHYLTVRRRSDSGIRTARELPLWFRSGGDAGFACRLASPRNPPLPRPITVHAVDLERPVPGVLGEEASVGEPGWRLVEIGAIVAGKGPRLSGGDVDDVETV